MWEDDAERCSSILWLVGWLSCVDEDILANVSVERSAEGRLTGFVRIRSKTQGVAVGIGERITLKQRG